MAVEVSVRFGTTAGPERSLNMGELGYLASTPRNMPHLQRLDGTLPQHDRLPAAVHS